MREPEPLVCGDCGRRFKWQADYQTKPCPNCRGRLRPQSASYVRADQTGAGDSPFADAGHEPPIAQRPQPRPDMPVQRSTGWSVRRKALIVIALIVGLVWVKNVLTANHSTSSSTAQTGTGASKPAATSKRVVGEVSRFSFKSGDGYSYDVSIDSVALAEDVANAKPGSKFIFLDGNVRGTVTNKTSGRNAPTPFFQIFVAIPGQCSNGTPCPGKFNYLSFNALAPVDQIDSIRAGGSLQYGVDIDYASSNDRQFITQGTNSHQFYWTVSVNNDAPSYYQNLPFQGGWHAAGGAPTAGAPTWNGVGPSGG